MPTLAGWLTGEQVPREIIDQTLTAMGNELGQRGGYTGQPARAIQPGAGLIAFSDTTHAMIRNDEPPLLDWVPDRRTMVYRRPLSGAHVLYYVEDWPAQGNLLFASEIKALLAVGVPRTLHLAALDALLRYGFIPAPWTAFQAIRVVPAGSILRWQRAKTVMNAATDYSLEKSYPSPNAAEHLQTLLDTTIAGLLPPHDQLVALTDGTAPSALATVLTARHTQAPFTIASFGYKKSLPSQAWRSAEVVAEACQRPFLTVIGVDQPEFWLATLTGLEAPVMDARALAFHQVFHTVAVETDARVAMSGLGASMLSGSKAPVLDEQVLARLKSQDMLGWYSQVLSAPFKTTGTVWSQDALQQLRRDERWETTLHAQKLARQAAKFKDKRLAWYYLDLHLRLPDQIVSTAQKLAIQEHLALRSPYLHADVIDVLSRLPFVLNEGKPKDVLLSRLLKHVLADWEEKPSTLPLQVPMQSLLQGEQSELLQLTLSPEAIRARGIFDVQVVEELLRQKEVSRELLLVFTTQLLCQLFEAGL